MSFRARIPAAIRVLLRHLSPDCREVSRLQAGTPDAPLPRARRFGLRMHLMLCQWCRRYGQQIRFLRTMAHEHPEELCDTPSQRLSPEARTRLKQSLPAAPRQPGA